MKNQITKLQEIIDAGYPIRATYVPNGESVKILEVKLEQRPFVKFQNGVENFVDLNDLIEFRYINKSKQLIFLSN